MAFVGDIGTALPGEIDIYPINFAQRLSIGETISSGVAKMQIWPESPSADPNAANLVLGTPTIVGPVVGTICGGLSSAGFQPGAVYSLFVWATTSLGRTIESFGNITCLNFTPPTLSSMGTMPSNSQQIFANTTASSSTTYVIMTAGITFTLPPTWGFGLGAVTLVDLTGASDPDITVAGSIGNTPSSPLIMHNAGFSLTFLFLTATSQWVII